MTKTCTKCKESKELSEFRKDKSRPDGLTSQCKACLQSFYKRSYREKDGHKVRARVRNKRNENAARLLEYKKQHSCSMCGEDDYICLDFHHVNSDKEFGIANSLLKSWDKILTEIQKCIIVCSNCHRKLHRDLNATIV